MTCLWKINEINEKCSLKSVYFNQFRLVQLFIATSINSVDNPLSYFNKDVNQKQNLRGVKKPNRKIHSYFSYRYCIIILSGVGAKGRPGIPPITSLAPPITIDMLGPPQLQAFSFEDSGFCV